MGIINCENVTLHYGTKEILNEITLNVNPGSKVGVIGVNGAGKSTLFRIICGQQEKTSGIVRISPKTVIKQLSQYSDSDYDAYTVREASLLPFAEQLRAEKELDALSAKLSDGTASENDIERFAQMTERFGAIGGYEYKARAASYMEKLGFGPDMADHSVEKLSGGQKMRIALGVMLLTECDVYLLDEPTNHLDTDAVEWLEEVILSSKKTYMIISHDRYFLDRVTDCTLEIENTRSMMYTGSYSVFREKKKKLLETQQKHYELQQKEIKRLEDFIANQRKWNRERNIIAAESRMKVLDKMVKIDKVQNAPKPIRFKIATSSSIGTDVLFVKNLCKAYGKTQVLSNLSFDVKRNDRFFILGRNGSGKSTLLKILTGRENESSGEYRFGYNQKIGYYDQEQQQLNDLNSVISELWDDHPEMTQTEIRSYLASFNFTGEDIYKEISVISGGERARLTIAKLVLAKISVLILDEPTNHLDIDSREVLEDALSNFDGTVICVSHDRYFIKKLATRILTLTDCDYSVFNGSYDEYLEKKRSENTVVSSSSKKTENEYFVSKQKRSEQRRKAGGLARLESQIASLEAELSELSDKILENSSDYKKLDLLYAEQEEKKEKLDELYLVFLEESE